MWIYLNRISRNGNRDLMIFCERFVKFCEEKVIVRKDIDFSGESFTAIRSDIAWQTRILLKYCT